MTGKLDPKRLVDLFGKLLDAVESPFQWELFLEDLARLLDAHGFALRHEDFTQTGSADNPAEMTRAFAPWFEQILHSETSGLITQNHRLAVVLRSESSVTIIGFLRRQNDLPFQARAYSLFALIAPLIARVLSFQRGGPSRSPRTGLPVRQREVLTLGAQGLRSKEIADRLGLSTRTVEHHFTAAAKRLTTRGRSQTIATALEMGLITS